MTTPTLPQVSPTTPDLGALLLARAHVKHALAGLSRRKIEAGLAWRYYNGDHPMLWMTDKMGELFKDQATALQDNFCEIAVDAVLSRLAVTGWEAAEAAVEAEARRTGSVETAETPTGAVDPLVAAATEEWDANGLDLEQEDLYRHALVGGVGYVMVWPNEAGTLEAVVQDPMTVWVEYGGLRPGDRRWAARVWHDADQSTWRATVFYPDRVVRMMVPGRSNPSTPLDASRLVLDPDDPGGPNPLPQQVVPVVPFERRRNAPSRLKNLWPIQDKINKLAANKMVAAEFAAFRQRVFITTQQVSRNTLRNAPDEAIVLDPGTPDAPTSIHEFAVTELSNYDGSIDREIAKFFTVAALPRHLIVGTGAAPPSGEAIRADEGPFVAYVDSLVKRFTASWRDVMGLMGLPVKPVWADTEVSNDPAIATTVKTFADAGVPVMPLLTRYAGWSEDDAAEAQAQVTASAAQAAAAGAVALAAFDQGASPSNALPPL